MCQIDNDQRVRVGLPCQTPRPTDNQLAHAKKDLEKVSSAIVVAYKVKTGIWGIGSVPVRMRPVWTAKKDG